MKTVFSPQAPAAIGPYSQAILSGDFLYVSGQIPVVPETGKLAEGDFTAQARQVFLNLSAILEAGGSDFEHVVKSSCYLVDMADFAAFNEEYARYFPQKPARCCISVSALPKNARVEVEVIAEIIRR